VSPAELKAAGIEAYLVKPVKQSRLFDCVVSAMGKGVAETVPFKGAEPASSVICPAPSLPLEKVRILTKPVRPAELQAAFERWQSAVQQGLKKNKSAKSNIEV
jgi:two-component system sensor histidine kinase/response regulator